MKNILEQAEFQSKLSQIATEKSLPIETVKDEAAGYMKEMFTEHKPLYNAIAVQGIQYILGRAYDKTIDVNPSEIKALAKEMRRHSVAFVMTHKTYIDMMVLGAVLARHGLPLPYTFSGINMSFLGVGEFGRKSGVIFIRRNIKDNDVYKATLRYFIASLVQQRAHFMWAIEGTRSRTGKLVWPMMGILKYIVEAQQDSGQEVRYVPVSIVYDLIPDVQDMIEEGRGKIKKPENLLWFANYIKKMGDGFGKISLRFGSPIEMSGLHQASIPDDENNDPSSGYTLPRFAFELIHNINTITPVTTASLIITTLLSKFALSKKAIERDVIELMKHIERHRADVLVDRGIPIGESVQLALNLLLKANLIHQLSDGIKAKYAIVTSNFLQAIYYANMSVHHLYHRAFIELTILKIADLPGPQRQLAFWEEIMRLRDLFKFEFFYTHKASFCDQIEADLYSLSPDWAKILFESDTNLRELLAGQPILIAQTVLSIYLEAYKVVGKALQNIQDRDQIDEISLLRQCLFLGEEMHWQGHIHRLESVSKPLLQNGIRLAKNRDIIPLAGQSKKKQINLFIKELEEVSRRLRELQHMIMDLDNEEAIIPLDRQIVPGSKTESITTEVIQGGEGAHIGAFFDLDRTLIKGFSANEFYQRRLMSGKMKPREIAAQFAGVLVYALGNRNFGGLATIGAQGVNGLREEVFIEVGEEVYRKHLAQAIYPESRALVAAHMAKGHTVAIISAATPYQVDPIARDLGIEHVMCTRMKVKNGKFTGEVEEPVCWGEGKAQAARTLANDLGLDLSKSFFYTDSIEDRPLLDIVGHPHALNPDRDLSALAFANDWPVTRFNDEVRPGIANFLRTGLAFGTLLPAAISGVVSGTTTLSWREGVNSMIATIGDLGTTLAGIKLVVKGKENLWSHRPAVFIFNHQSNADFFIASKLIRKDTVAIAKKELKYTPIGPIFMAAGVIFIDRKNKDKSIEALKPAVDVLKSGISVAIAPEGTRSYDYQLGNFKKGAFHLAMQAGVPIVPIVIKNAHDVMPRGKAFVNPSSVEVKILTPVSTKDWTVENMNDNIEKIRQAYLKELGQVELPLLIEKASKS